MDLHTSLKRTPPPCTLPSRLPRRLTVTPCTSPLPELPNIVSRGSARAEPGRGTRHAAPAVSPERRESGRVALAVVSGGGPVADRKGEWELRFSWISCR